MIEEDLSIYPFIQIIVEESTITLSFVNIHAGIQPL